MPEVKLKCVWLIDMFETFLVKRVEKRIARTAGLLVIAGQYLSIE